jgi:hypothetical protein
MRDAMGLKVALRDARAEAIMRGIVGVFELPFWGHVRGCYLLGSYVETGGPPRGRPPLVNAGY